MALFWILQYLPFLYRKLFAALYYIIMTLWSVLVVLHILGPIGGFLDPVRTAYVPLILLRHLAESVNVGSTGLVLILLVTVVALYVLLERIFRRIEAPLGKVKPVWKEYG
jgi:hypothetical protein